MKMNSILGKKILQIVRGQDFAHAGEEEAIRIVMDEIPQYTSNHLLDVGCGTGGTAEFIQGNGWGRVVGVDFDPENIEYANKNHPDIKFCCIDVNTISNFFGPEFDLVYMFNSFYAFSDQLYALSQLRKVSKNSGRILLFDYVNPLPGKETNFTKNKLFFNMRPVILNEIDDMMLNAGWKVYKKKDLFAEYKRWYALLVERIKQKKNEIENLAGSENYEYVITFYSSMYDSVFKGELGGAVIYAEAV